jgi:hypothetical protein
MKKIEILGFIVFISFILWVIIGSNMNQFSLLENGKIVNAKVVSWASPGKGGTVYNLRCEFAYNGKRYKLFSPTTYSGNFNNIIGKTFPGMFSESREVFEVLITRADFEKFDIPFPDSLNWTKK